MASWAFVALAALVSIHRAGIRVASAPRMHAAAAAPRRRRCARGAAAVTCRRRAAARRMPVPHIDTGAASATNTRAAHFPASGVAGSFIVTTTAPLRRKMPACGRPDDPEKARGSKGGRPGPPLAAGGKDASRECPLDPMTPPHLMNRPFKVTTSRARPPADRDTATTPRTTPSSSRPPADTGHAHGPRSPRCARSRRSCTRARPRRRGRSPS